LILVYTMPGVADMGMVWMGAGQPNPEMSMELMSGDNTDMLLEHENPYFTPSLHSMSNQSMDDINTIHSSQMVSGYKIGGNLLICYLIGWHGKFRYDAIY
jgi:hypothetical protein